MKAFYFSIKYYILIASVMRVICFLLFFSLNLFVQTHTLLTIAISNEMNSILSMFHSIVYKFHSPSFDFNGLRFGTVPGLRIQSQHGYLVVVSLDATGSNNGWTMEKSSHYFASIVDNNCSFALAIAYLSKCVLIKCVRK